MKVLLVEDDKFFRDFYAFKLQEKGVVIEIADNGEEGLKKITESPPDLVLLDLIMPKKDGFEVLTTMQQMGLTNTIPVLVFSTLGQEKDVEKARSLGARGYINKSFFDFDKLYGRILELAKK
jgi:two-component system response regulator VicR